MHLFLINFSNTNNRIKNKQLQSEISKYYCNYLLKHFFKIDSYITKDEKGKPFIKDSDLKISISHSNNIIALLFSKEIIGVDIENIKKRDYKKILKYYKIEKNLSLIEFYQLWTIYEAEFKSGIKKDILSFEYKNCICSISYSNKPILKTYEIKAPEKLNKSESNNLKEINVTQESFLQELSTRIK